MKYSRSESKAWARENMRGHWTTMVTPFQPDGENVVATKEAYPFFGQIVDVFKLAGDKIVVSCPHDEIYPYLELYGIRQQFLFANESDWMVDTPQSRPRREFLDLAIKGDMKKAVEIYRDKVGPIIDIRHKWFKYFRAQGIFPVHLGKYWGELVGMAGGSVRLPSVPLTEEQKQSIREDLQKVDFFQSRKRSG